MNVYIPVIKLFIAGPFSPEAWVSTVTKHDQLSQRFPFRHRGL